MSSRYLRLPATRTLVVGDSTVEVLPSLSAKDYTEVVSYVVDFVDRLTFGETLSAGGVAIAGGTVLATSPTFSGTEARMVLQQGDPGEVDTITLTCYTSSNEIVVARVTLGVVGATVAPGPTPAPPPTPAYDGYTYIQSVPSTTWNIEHNLGRVPNVNVVSSSGDVVDMDIHIVDMNNIILTSAGAFSGTAYLD